MRGLPDFLIIGAPRCGTSSLFLNFLQHPQIDGPQCKEVHFFNRNKGYRRGIRWYKNQFPEIKKNVLCFEASPAYFYQPICVERIFKHLPSCKFILLLRNPVDRAISEYSRWIKPKKWNPHELMIKDPCHPFHVNFPSLEIGIYIKSLRRWLKYFSLDRILIIKSEDFFENEKKIILQCFDWLGVELVDIGKPLFYDQKGMVRERVPYRNKVPDDVKEYLKEFYVPYNRELYKLLGRNFGW